MKASQKTMGVLVMTFIAIVLGAITFSQKGQEWVNPYTGNVVLKSNLQLVIYLVPTMVAIFGVLWFAAKKEDDTGSVAIPNKGWKRIQKSCVTPMSAALLLIIVAIILLARSPQEAKVYSQTRLTIHATIATSCIFFTLGIARVILAPSKPQAPPNAAPS